MPRDSAQGSGKSLEEAIDRALAELGARIDEVDVEVVQQGGGGLFGIGAKPFVVRAARRAKPRREGPTRETGRAPRSGSVPGTSRTPRTSRGGESRGGAARGGTGRGGESRGSESRGEASRGRGSRASSSGPRERSQRREREPVEPRRAQEVRAPEGTEHVEPSAPWHEPESPRAPRYEPESPPAPRHEARTTPPGDDLADQARRETEWILESLGLEARVSARLEDDEIRVTIESDSDHALLIGRRGDTRIALQQVISRLVNPRQTPGARVTVDVNGYWSERVETLLARARRLAEQAAESGEEITMDPLPAEERRLVHRELAEDGRFETGSIGEGPLKRIVIRPLRGG